MFPFIMHEEFYGQHIHETERELGMHTGANVKTELGPYEQFDYSRETHTVCTGMVSLFGKGRDWGRFR